MQPASDAHTLEYLRQKLPGQIYGWSAEPDDRLYDDKTIFHYIDGGAEVYRAYRMRSCLSRRYSIPGGPGIVLDIFDMGSSEDAFGVFTHDTDGTPLDIGQDARYRPGWISFWKHRFFVSIYTEEETVRTREAVIKLAGRIADRIPETGQRPRILSKLPAAGLQKTHIRYLHHPIILNYHFYLADENILNLSDRTHVLLAPYRRSGGSGLLLLVQYPNSEEARRALAAFLKHYLPDGGDRQVVRLENGKWSGASLKRSDVAIVLEADARETAESLLKDIHP